MFLLDFAFSYFGPEKTQLLTLFWQPFGSLFDLIWASGGSPSLPMGLQRAPWGPLLEHLVFIAFFNGFWVPPGLPKRGSGGMVAYPLGAAENGIF